MKHPWMKFYPSDWRADPRLRMCSLAARGLWIDLIAYMHEGKPYGHLTINNQQPGLEDLSALLGRPVDEVSQALNELKLREIFSVSKSGAIFSRRMVRDAERAKKGRQAARKRWGQPNGSPNGSPNRSPIAYMPEARSQNDDVVDEGPRPAWEQSEAFGLAKQIAEAAGRLDEFEFTGWGGATNRVQTWLNSGWPAEIILASCREQAARKRNDPPSRIEYFEKGIAAFIARQAAPVPIVEIKPAEKIAIGSVSHETTSNLVAAQRRLIARANQIAAGGGGEAGQADATGGGTGASVVRLLPPQRCD